jgi:hypothetical protein
MSGCDFVVRITRQEIEIQNSGGISNHENVTYNSEVQMPSLNQVTTKCIW